MVYALNRVPPRYVASRQGSVITEVSLEKDQNRAAIDVAMMDGLRQHLAGAALRRETWQGTGLTAGRPR